ncbi:hypothetical protein TNCV_2970051 [Trichonephila clavipes]|nr:hypothetical protein TNCV_2970051 [Trichonephila clavipes]
MGPTPGPNPLYASLARCVVRLLREKRKPIFFVYYKSVLVLSSLQADRLIGTSTHAPQRPMVTYTGMDTLTGIGVLAVSIWLYFDSSVYLGNTDDSYMYFVAIFVLMAAGAIMFLIGLLGCCGALQESPCMLGTHVAPNRAWSGLGLEEPMVLGTVSKGTRCETILFPMRNG